ncbi:MAG: NAD(P)-dependent oxidoreductase [Chloroflexi bacterium]|nr:NAD(P)-dependent oxidoreductase [Chloroflexota bacterium]
MVGFIGLGLMGKPMALNALRQGFSLAVHNRSRAAVEALVAAGARDGGSPRGVAEGADVVITMLPDGPDVRTVLEGSDGVLAGIRPGGVIVDMSTISPVAARELAQLCAAKGVQMLDAPVSGGTVGAESGTLSIMVGGERATLERVRPLLESMGNPEKIVYIGESGAGQLCKVCNQMAIGGALAAISEAFALCRKAGVDPAPVREALLGGFAASRVLEVHGQRILDGNYVPGFKASMFVKDYRIVLETAQAHGVPVPTAATVAQLVQAVAAQGMGEDDYSSLARVVARSAGLEDSGRGATSSPPLPTEVARAT